MSHVLCSSAGPFVSITHSWKKLEFTMALICLCNLKELTNTEPTGLFLHCSQIPDSSAVIYIFLSSDFHHGLDSNLFCAQSLTQRTKLTLLMLRVSLRVGKELEWCPALMIYSAGLPLSFLPYKDRQRVSSHSPLGSLNLCSLTHLLYWSILLIFRHFAPPIFSSLMFTPPKIIFFSL